MNATGTGRLDAIWIKTARGGPMQPAESAAVVADRGIVGNANQGGRRQVTIIAREAWQRLMEETGGSLDPAARRANLMVSGIALEQTRGRVLRIGSCRVEIAGETRPCGQMDDARPGLRDAMRADWGGGVFGVVLDDGEVRVGDPVRWEA